MTLAKNEHSEVRSASGIILYAKHTVVSNSWWLLEIIPPQAEDIADIRGIPEAKRRGGVPGITKK
jgi:hypothetical protein